MSDIDNISITLSNIIDNIEIDYDSTVDGIIYSSPVDDINIEYDSEVDNITLNLSSAIVTGAAVTSVNSLTDSVILTASGQLNLTTASNNYYNHFFYHNLNYQSVIVHVFNPNNELVFADIINEDSNYVNIRAAIDLTGYKVVAQR
jgi:hypothetical protein